jgi:hypothetical protein
MNLTKLLSTVGLALGLCQLASADLIHRYSFTTDASDSVGGEKFKGMLVGGAGGGPTIAGGQLQLNNPNNSPGGGNYLNLPPSILPTNGSATIEEWFTFTPSGRHTEAFAFAGAIEPGPNTGQYLMATISGPQGGPVPGQGGSHIAETLAGFDGGETDAYETTPGLGLNGGGYLDDGQTYMLAVVIDAKAGTLSYYLNGKLQQSVAAIPLSDYQFAQAYLGRSPIPDDNATSGSIDEFRIYNDAQSADAIAAQYAVGPDLVAGTEAAVAAVSEPKNSKHGGIGLGTWATQVQYTNLVVTKHGQVLFQSDFDQHFGDWQTGNGSWSVSNGLLSQTSSDTDCRVTAGKADWSNYTISVRARKTEGDEGFLIMFNVQDKDNWTWWNIGGWGNTLEAVENCVNGEKTSLGERVPYEVKPGEWYDLRVEIEGLTIRGYINNTLVRTATYPGSADTDMAAVAPTTPAVPAPDAQAAPAGGVKLKVVKADSEETVAEHDQASNAVDGDKGTFWHTQWQDAAPGCPHEITIELTPAGAISGFTYLPRQDESENGTIKDYEFYVSNDGENFGQPVAKGTFENSKELKRVNFATQTCRFIKLKALSEVNDGAWTSAAEIGVIQP